MSLADERWTKEKESIDRLINGESAWKQEPENVFYHDFLSYGARQGTPHRSYDLQATSGWVGLGPSHDLPEFAADYGLH